MWQPQTPTVIANNPDFVSIQIIDVREAFYNYDNLTTGPAAAALAISNRIAAERFAGRVADDTVCVLLKNFGDDHDPEAAKPLTFYTVDDRLPALSETAPSPFPVLPQPGADDGSARNYRHPLLENGTAANPPLKQWMTMFCDALDNQYNNRLTGPIEQRIPHPATFRWYFDTEVIPNRTNANGMAMLGWLAQHEWNTRPVAGYKTSSGTPMSLQQVYLAERERQCDVLGLPYTTTDARVFPVDILDASAGIAFGTAGLDADFGNNPRFYEWWVKVSFDARNAVMEHCAYSVLRAQWGPDVRCGNYEDTRADGLVDTTPWYHDLHGTGPGVRLVPDLPVPAVPAYDRARLSNESRRLVPARGSGRLLLERFNADDIHGLSRRTASGTHDSPSLYPLREIQPGRYDLDGNPAMSPAARPARQINPYIPPEKTYPLVHDGTGQSDAESALFSTLRIDRQTVEASIESFGGGGQTRLAPWVAQNLLETSDVDIFDYYRGERQLRGLLAMLRAKNVPELLWFTGKGHDPNDGSFSWDHAWNATEHVVYRAWGVEVEGATRVSGTLPPGYLVADEPFAMLEYTLRPLDPDPMTAPYLPAGPYTFDTFDDTPMDDGDSDPNTNPERMTRVVVDFVVSPDGLSCAPPPPGAWLADTSRYSYDVMVELQSSDPYAFVKAFAWNYVQGRWQLFTADTGEFVPAVGRPGTQGFAAYGTPDGTLRRRFRLLEPGFTGEAGGSPRWFVSSDAAPRMRLKFALISTEPSLLTKLDLVQVIPTCKVSPVNTGLIDMPLGNTTELDDLLVTGRPFPLMDAECVPPNGASHEAERVFLNSAFCHLPPDCPGTTVPPCYENAEVRLRFAGTVCMTDETSPAVFIRKVGGDPTFNYAPLMEVAVRRPGDPSLSPEIVIHGDGSTLLVEGEYEVSPVLDNVTGEPVAPFADGAWPLGPIPLADDFAYTFTLVSDCNRNGWEDTDEIDERNALDAIDVWPLDGLIDECHPELCEPDYTQDGLVNQDDVDCLIAVLAGNPACAPSQYTDPDFNADGVVDQSDIDALINTVAGNGCP